MKKFYWLLLFINLFIGYYSHSDEVMNMLEDKTDKYTKLQKENLVLFCSDLDEILEIKKDDGLSAFLNKSETNRKKIFKEKYSGYIENHTVKESAEYLSDPYFESNLGTFLSNSREIRLFLDSIIVFPLKEDAMYYKIANLHLIWTYNTFVRFEPYDSPERAEILANNDLEWQKKKYKDIIAKIKEWITKSKD